MRRKEITVWNGSEEKKMTITTFSALEQIKHAGLQMEIGDFQEKYDSITEEIESIKLKSAEEKRKLNVDEVKKVSDLNKESMGLLGQVMHKMSELVVNCLAKSDKKYKYNEAGSNVKEIQDEVLGMFDIQEMKDIIGFAFGGEELMSGFRPDNKETSSSAN